MAAGVVIERARTRVTCADAPTAVAARALIAAATERLPAALEALLGDRLPADEIALPAMRIELHCRVDEPVGQLADRWAAAVAQAIGATVAAPAAVPAATAASVAAGIWADERATLIRLVSAPEGERPSRIATILTAWLARDPARAVAELVALRADGIEFDTVLHARDAARLTLSLLAALRAAGRSVEPTANDRDDDRGATTVTPVADAMAIAGPASLRALLALLVRAPGDAVALAAMPVDQALARLLGTTRRGGGGEHGAARDAPAGDAEQARREERSLPSGTAHPDRGTATAAAPTGSAAATAIEPAPDVLCGGLLLLLRPVLTLLPAGERRSARLLGAGLAALHRVAAPLAPTPRRLMLERDRTLLAVFAGCVPDAAPLIEQVPDAQADALLADLLDRAPYAAWAPRALDRVFRGADPFADDPATATLARLLLRPGQLILTPWRAELVWPLDAADVAIRRAGWDIDPGWLPWAGRSFGFRYEARP